MDEHKTHAVSLEKSYKTDSKAIYDLFKPGVLFKLTGADEIESHYEAGGRFQLTFKDRGVIHGQFLKMTSSDIVMEWNVEGFKRPAELKTIVEINIKEQDDRCILVLHHKNIELAESAAAKQRAWTEILNELEDH